MKPWPCRNCHEWNVAEAKRCATCGVRREHVVVATDAEGAARLAGLCAAVPGIAGVFADLARAIRSYATENQVDLETIQPEMICTPTGKVIFELGRSA
jgi:hypothetical protein